MGKSLEIDAQDDLGHLPERRCIVTGESQPKVGLIRFGLGPDGQVVPDVLERLPGRGFYVVASRGAIEKAVTKGLFARAARKPVTLQGESASGLCDLLEKQLARRVVDLLSMARKASKAVTGFEKVKDWLTKDKAAVLIQASDGSERGKTKLHPPEGPNAFIGCLTQQELGLAFGRDYAIHVALAAGGLTKRIVEEAARLTGIREHIGGMTVKRDTKDA